MGGINAEYMGIVLSAFITTTCSKLLLWFVLLLMPRLRPRPIQLFSMELTAMLVMLPHTLTAMLDIHMPTPPSPDTAPPTELTPLESTDSPPLLSQLLPEDTPLPEDTSPTLPESSMLPRERLRLMPMLMLSTDTTDMPDLMLTVLDTEATDMDTHMPMVVSTERDPLMLSQRPRLMLLSSTEPTDTDSDTPDTLPMVLTHMPTDLTHMPMMLTMDTTDMPDLMLTVLDTPDTDMDTHMVMDMPGESKLFQPKVLSYCKPKAQ